MNRPIVCFPFGARVGSSTDGIVISIIGLLEGKPVVNVSEYTVQFVTVTVSLTFICSINVIHSLTVHMNSSIVMRLGFSIFIFQIFEFRKSVDCYVELGHRRCII